MNFLLMAAGGKPLKNVLQPVDDEARRLARTLIRTARFGALAVLNADGGSPAVSRISIATDSDGAPITLMSSLAPHRAAVEASPRCALLLGEPGKGDPLAHPRISLACTAIRLDRDELRGKQARSRFLRRHPKAALYADFGDFSFFRLEPLSASLNGGFARAYELDSDDVLIPEDLAHSVAAIESEAIDHMNADHGDAVRLYATILAGQPDASWTIIGIDSLGIDLAAGDQTARVDFDDPLKGASELRPRLTDMARQARRKAGTV